jgi:hypothetical protein
MELTASLPSTSLLLALLLTLLSILRRCDAVSESIKGELRRQSS